MWPIKVFMRHIFKFGLIHKFHKRYYAHFIFLNFYWASISRAFINFFYASKMAITCFYICAQWRLFSFVPNSDILYMRNKPGVHFIKHFWHYKCQNVVLILLKLAFRMPKRDVQKGLMNSDFTTFGSYIN